MDTHKELFTQGQNGIGKPETREYGDIKENDLELREGGGHSSYDGGGDDLDWF